jgi:hypothetical protein
MKFFPIRMLRKGLAGGVESGSYPFEDTIKLPSEQAVRRFKHYELVKGKDGNRLSWAGVRWGSLTKPSTSIFTLP